MLHLLIVPQTESVIYCFCNVHEVSHHHEGRPLAVHVLLLH